MVPILLFAYKRPLHLKKVLEALLGNPECASSELFVFIDGPKNKEDESLIDEVRTIISRLSGFKKIHVKQSTKNLGLGNSLINGISEIFESYESIIVLEDDILVSRDFLTFMNACLSKYKANKLIASVSGYSFQPVIPDEYKAEVVLSKRASSWGWGTWRDRWNEVNWDLTNFENTFQNKKKLEGLRLAGNDIVPMLVKYERGIIDSWAVRWTYHHFLRDQYCLVSRFSKVDNIGTDGSGTHFTTRTNRYHVPLIEKAIQLPDNPRPHYKILESFRRVYTPSIFRRVLNYLTYSVW